MSGKEGEPGVGRVFVPGPGRTTRGSGVHQPRILLMKRVVRALTFPNYDRVERRETKTGGGANDLW